MKNKPNIIFFICDSMDGRKMGCMGNRPLRNATAHMDALAADGTVFENTYCNNPVCCPSRASMYAGQYTFHCHAWNNYKGIPAASETFKTALQREGYLFGEFGKTDYISGRHTQRARVSAWLRSAGIMRPQYNMPAPLLKEDFDRRCAKQDWEVVDRGLEFLEAHKNAADPFFLYISVASPHPRCVTNRYYYDKIDREAIEIPVMEEKEHPVMEYMRFCKNWHHTPTAASVREARAIYYAMIAEVDEMLGTVMDACRGLENTYFVFVSDHGEMNMEHGQFYKYTAYEPSARVPLIIAGPGLQKGGRHSHLTSLVDIFPTLLSLTGAKTTRKLDGSSLLPYLKGEPDRRENIALCEYHDSGARTGIIMLRKDNFKYIAYPGYQPQLFDLDADPGELHDLSEEMPEKCAELDSRLRAITDYEAHDHMVKTYDHDCFRVWRDCHKAAGDYDSLMARIFCGADDEAPAIIPPWTQEDERAVEKWLEEDF